MAEIYLTPEDISPSDTRIVLAFLNSVSSADEIATRIEIPNELDIGVRLGQRILDARQQLGGSFSSLQELMNVPLIGPERFTEVVTEALNKSALDILAGHSRNGDTPHIAAMASQLQAFQKWASEFESLQTNRYKIEVKLLDKTPYLGEIIPLRIRVWDRISRSTKANLPLTIETNWGNLRWNKGLQIKQGSVLSLKTGVSGDVICYLHTPTLEPLTEPQQNELSLALGKLSHSAMVPEQARDSFLSLTASYQHPLNVDLRDAIDIHYKSRKDRISESINLQTSIYSWNYEQALVRVYAHPPGGEDQTVTSMSAVPIEFRDWLSPWYQFYKDGLIGGQDLQTGLSNAFAYSDNEQGIINHLLSNVHSFIAHQNGLLGENVGQQASKEILARVLAENQQDLTANTKASLYTLLGQASRDITASNKGSLGAANEMALDVGRTSGIYDAVGDLGNLTAQFDGLQSAFQGIDTRMGSLESATADINFDQLTSDLSSFSSDYASFNKDYAAFNSNYATFNSNYATFNSDYASFNNNYSSFNNDYSNFNNDYADFNNNYGQWQIDLGDFNTNYGNFQTGLNDFNLAKDQLITNVTNGVNAALTNIASSVSGASGTPVAINPVDSVVVGRNFNGPTGRG